MKKGKVLFADSITPESMELCKDAKCYTVSNGKVNSKTQYIFNNWIVTPNKETFVLLNPETGKKKRAKSIFVVSEFKPYENYKGYEIDFFADGFTVCYCGDEVYFSTKKEAMAFIDEICDEV